MIPRDYITELVQRSDIVDVVQSYVQLRHRGRTHTGLCPFHNEKTPSFVVYPETQSFLLLWLRRGRRRHHLYQKNHMLIT